MKKKIIVVLSAMVVMMGSIWGVAYADNLNALSKKDGTQIIASQDKDTNVESINLSSETQASNKFSKDVYTDMINIMQENGFGDAAKYMQDGNYAKMNEFMNNLSDEDYQKMIGIMQQNGYGYMAQMMQSIGREGMNQMHNSAYGMHSSGYGMMGGFVPEKK
ncbi:MAG: hypothetical protein ACM3TR_18430 [Caulobacteraceae bacterium]